MLQVLNFSRIKRPSGEPKVGELDVACRVDEEVLRQSRFSDLMH